MTNIDTKVNGIVPGFELTLDEAKRFGAKQTGCRRETIVRYVPIYYLETGPMTYLYRQISSNKFVLDSMHRKE